MAIRSGGVDGGERFDRLGRLLDDAEQDVEGSLLAVLLIGRAPGDEVVQERAHGVDVRQRADLVDLPERLLRRHVERRAHHRSVHREERRVEGAVARLLPIAADRGDERERRVRGRRPAQVARVLPALGRGEAPVHDVGLAVLAHHDVGRLEVAVDDALGVGVGHGLADLQQDVQGACHRPVVVPFVDELEDLAQVAAAHERHREVDLAVLVDAHLVHRDDSGVVELARDLRLLEEARQLQADAGRAAPRGGVEDGRLLLVLEHHLHGEGPLEVEVEHAQDRPHAAAGDLAHRLVAGGVGVALGGELRDAGHELLDGLVVRAWLARVPSAGVRFPAVGALVGCHHIPPTRSLGACVHHGNGYPMAVRHGSGDGPERPGGQPPRGGSPASRPRVLPPAPRRAASWPRRADRCTSLARPAHKKRSMASGLERNRTASETSNGSTATTVFNEHRRP